MEPLFILNGVTLDEVVNQLQAAKAEILSRTKERPYALVVTGQAYVQPDPRPPHPLPPTHTLPLLRRHDGWGVMGSGLVGAILQAHVSSATNQEGARAGCGSAFRWLFPSQMG
jgi:hypothetical protein